MHTKFWPGDLKGGYHLEDVSLDERIILEWVLEKYGGEMWTGFMWVRIWTSNALLRAR